MTSPVSHGQLFYQPVVQTPASTNAAPQERKNPKKEPEILAACRTGNLEWVKELLRGNPDYINQTFMAGNKMEFMVSPLYLASQEGRKEVVDFLLENKADKDSQFMNGATPLFIASQNGHKDIIALLLAQNANPDLSRNNGATPLFVASQEGHDDIVAHLLAQQSVNPDRPRNDGTTPLITSSWRGHKETVELLLNARANPDFQHNKGNATALYIAAEHGHEEIVKLLKASGANPFLKNRESGRRPLEAAQIQCKKNPQKRDIYLRIIEELKTMEKEWKAAHPPKSKWKGDYAPLPD